MIHSLKNYFPIMLIIFIGLSLCQINLLAQTESSKDSINSDVKNISLLVQDFIEAINSGDRDIMKDFILKHYDKRVLKRAPMDMIIGLNMTYYYESGGMGYKLHNIHPKEDKQVQIDLYNNLTDALVNIQIPISPAVEINWLLNAKPVFLGDGTESKNLTDEEIVNRLKNCLDLLDEKEEFSGTVIFSKGGKKLLSKAYGYASKEYSIPNKFDTKFNLASVGKIFTGIAVLQLVEKGKLSLEDTIDNYLSEDWLKPEISSKIQIKHLLTHTSGLDDYFKEAYEQSEIPVFRNFNDYRSLIANDTLKFEPGSKFSYSNVGAFLLGIIIEKVSNKDYFEYLRENIFDPVGMVNSGGFFKDRPVWNRATGYTKTFEDGKAVWDNNQYTRIMRGTASGGVYSSAEDMLKFSNSLKLNKLLSPENTKLVFEGRSDLDLSWRSYVFFLKDSKLGRIASHQGDGRGANCNFKMYLDAGYSIIILSNYSRPSAEIVANVIEQLLEY